MKCFLNVEEANQVDDQTVKHKTGNKNWQKPRHIPNKEDVPHGIHYRIETYKY